MVRSSERMGSKKSRRPSSADTVATAQNFGCPGWKCCRPGVTGARRHPKHRSRACRGQSDRVACRCLPVLSPVDQQDRRPRAGNRIDRRRAVEIKSVPQAGKPHPSAMSQRAATSVSEPGSPPIA